jgi:hypothetical protein
MATSDGANAMQHLNLLDDYPVELDRVPDDVEIAQRTVVIHQAEDWPAGRYLDRNDHTRWPCRLYRSGRAVLEAAGWSAVDIAALGSPASFTWSRR